MNNPSTMKNPDLIRKGFLHSAWDAEQPENRYAIEQLWQEIERRSLERPALLADFDNACRQGRHACDLVKQLKRKFTKGQDISDIEQWLDKVGKNSPSRVTKYLKRKLANEIDYRKNLAKRFRNTGSPVQSTLEPPAFDNDHHPNSLRHLLPSQQWQVFVDETGTDFSSSEAHFDANSCGLGRVVALAIPQRIQLDPLPEGFHAKSATYSQVDKAVQRLLDKRVGIFGFTVRDPLAYGGYWMTHILRLIRWVLYLMPIDPQDNTSVKFFIEQYSGFKPGYDLSPLSQTLEDELKAIDPERFGKLSLSLKIIGKTQHFENGYVDALAFTWGSQSKVSRDRLKKSALLGHCLLHPDSEQGLEHLYLALNAQGRLAPHDWYHLCAAAAQEPRGGLLGGFLARWGEHVKHDKPLWQACLQQIRQQLQSKRYRLPELVAALEWLETWSPPGSKLSRPLRMQLETARLAVENHHGQFDPERFETCLKLADTLLDECAGEVCEVYLRLAVMHTNQFEFDQPRAYLQPWFEEPVAVPGVLNLAKLYSTLGQLDAFQRRPDDALAQFDKALQLFARLSDPESAQRESIQTRTYRLIALMDSAKTVETELYQSLSDYLCEVAGCSKLEKAVRRLAGSREAATRFAHHLLLRALIAHPATFAEMRQQYLEHLELWQSDDHHPWPLIDTYRGWLLCMDQLPDRAEHYLQDAIERCAAEHNGITLHWMAEVLRALARSLGLKVHPVAGGPARDALRQRLPKAPQDALDRLLTLPHDAAHEQRWAALGDCLPFNFR